MNVRIPRVKIFKIALLSALWCGACASDTPTDLNPLGTETNWLKGCQSDAECGDLSCECGICTDPCATDTQCTVPGAKCRASDGPEVNGLCAASAQTAALCLPTCTASCDTDEVCLGDRCVAPRSGTAPDASLDDASTVSSSTAAASSSAVMTSQSTAVTASATSAADAGLLSDADVHQDASSMVDSGVTPDAACTFDSCHPDRCDAVGEPCCDPLPSDGPNYCNNGLTCGANGCEDPAAEDGPLCGATQCAADEVCCDRCGGACVSMFTELLCAEDDRPATFTCEGEAPAFYCGPSTVCSDPTTEYCRIFQGGLPGPPSYDCLDLPTECAADPTCECTLQNISDSGAQCETGPNGELTVTPLPAP